MLKDGAVIKSGDYNPLHRAVKCNHLDVVSLLLNEGAKIDSTGVADITALELAAVFGHLDIVKFLVEKGADIHGKPGEDSSPLITAAYEGRKDVVRLLLEKLQEWLGPYSFDRSRNDGGSKYGGVAN